MHLFFRMFLKIHSNKYLAHLDLCVYLDHYANLHKIQYCSVMKQAEQFNDLLVPPMTKHKIRNEWQVLLHL